MADAPNEPAPEGEKPDDAPEDTAGLKSALETERAERKEAQKEAKRAADLEKRLKEYEDRDKSEQEKVAERLAAAEKAAQDAESRYLRTKVALEKGLPATLANRLQGSTEEEMAADADELLVVVGTPKKPPSFDGGPREPAPSADADMNSRIRQQLGR